MHKKQLELKSIYLALTLLFLVFLFTPAALLLYQSFQQGDGLSLTNYVQLFQDDSFWESFKNSFLVSGVSSLITVLLAFLLAYTIHYTNLARRWKKLIHTIATLPMLLPTITYGFAIIYTFGKQGILSKLLGIQPFEIYGFSGLLIGYVIYTLPIAFLLVNNTMNFIDKKFIVVSKLMNDSTGKRFWMTVLAPMIPTLAAAMIQAFFLCFTDFGIPAAVGGEYHVVATDLYNHMLGAVPDFQQGAVIAMMMLLPSILSIVVLGYLDRYHIKYNKNTTVELPKNPLHDRICACIATLIMMLILLLFAVIFLLPFIKEWPYDIRFTLKHVTDTLTSGNLLGVYRNSLLVAILTALAGTLIAYGAALVTMRSRLSTFAKKSMDAISSISNTIPGMVLGIAFLLSFRGTSLQNTFFIIIICNIIHFFSTPYVMAKNALGKMNAGYETTAMLMGDTWLQTIRRVVVPNSKSTLMEMFCYYFVNAMVTISALIFIVGAKTAVLTTKIKELQHFAKFDEIFVLSLLILFTNLLVKGITYMLTKKSEKRSHIWIQRTVVTSLVLLILVPTFVYGSTKKQVIIYSNGDEEALSAMQHALNEHGYEGQYVLQSFGTSELGGKLMAEGVDLEADIVTMSSYYLDSAAQSNDMFEKLSISSDPIETTPDHRLPITALEGALIINTKVMEENHLPIPTSIKDLTKEMYEGYVSIPDINASSTGWLLVQAILDAYGEEEGADILTKLLKNVGPHLEASGSGPIKKVRSGEVGIAFGLRHQAVADEEKGLPIKVIDPLEGNMILTESLSIIKKEDSLKETMEMAECIITYAREELLETYPVILYDKEQLPIDHQSSYPTIYSQPLSVELLKEHQAFFDRCFN